MGTLVIGKEKISFYPSFCRVEATKQNIVLGPNPIGLIVSERFITKACHIFVTIQPLTVHFIYSFILGLDFLTFQFL